MRRVMLLFWSLNVMFVAFHNSYWSVHACLFFFNSAPSRVIFNSFFFPFSFTLYYFARFSYHSCYLFRHSLAVEKSHAHSALFTYAQVGGRQEQKEDCDELSSFCFVKYYLPVWGSWFSFFFLSYFSLCLLNTSKRSHHISFHQIMKI